MAYRSSMRLAIVALSGIALVKEGATTLASELSFEEFEKADASYLESGPLFELLDPGETGIDFINPIDLDHSDDRLYYSAMACGNVSSGDLDGDGRVDLFFANGPIGNRLYRQDSSFRFVDETGAAGVADEGLWSTASVLADVDGDGDLDIYVCFYDSPNRLYLNESSPGSVRFKEAASDLLVDVKDASLIPSFADFDLDGDLDLFLGMNAYYRKGGRPPGGVPVEKGKQGEIRILPPWDRFFGFSGVDEDSGEPKYKEIGRPNRLLRNDGPNRGFTDISAVAGIRAGPSHTNSAVWFDPDRDGDLDLFVGNDFADRDEFYRNRGDGTFEERAADFFQHTTWFSMGAAAEDFNNDGLTDLIAADMLPRTHFREKVTMGEMGSGFEAMEEAGLPIQKMVNTYFLNSGTGLFLESAYLSGLARSDWTWTVKSGDFDGDGWIDLFLPTGHTRDFNHSDLAFVTPKMRVGKNYWDFYEDIPELRESDVAFRNLDGWNFEAVEKEWGLGTEESMSYGVTACDIDRDGDLDLVVHRLNEPPAVYRNTAADRGKANFVQIQF
ncbi:MAG: VCBS repeat-containing protein, partial [Verrucomicrobiota bacterium]